MGLISNSEWEVLTPTGWQDFLGIKRSSRNDLLKIVHEHGSLTTTPEHLIKTVENEFKSTNSLINDTVLTNVGESKITDIIDVEGEHFVYDLIEVSNGHEYYTSNMISHNCAFIRDFEDIWTGLAPTISTGGSAILLSTPNGVGGQYYKLWVDAEAGQNDFIPIKLPWNVHPEHDQAWFNKETRSMPETKVRQEYLCEFAGSSDTFLQIEDMEWLYTLLDEPDRTSDIDRNLWVWDDPQPGHRYVVGADACRGNGADFATAHVIDMDELTVVAEYMSKVPADVLGDVLVKIGRHYNDALLAPENNSFGWFTACRVRDSGYPRLVYEKSRGDVYDYKPTSADEKPGFSTQKNSRDAILGKLEQAIRSKKLTIRSKRTFEQFRTFVWHGNKASAIRGANDDLIMSLAIANYLCADSTGEATVDDGSVERACLRALSVNRREASLVVPSVDDVRMMHVHRSGPGAPRPLRPGQRRFDPYGWLR